MRWRNRKKEIIYQWNTADIADAAAGIVAIGFVLKELRAMDEIA